MDFDTISGKTPLIFKVKISISQNKRKFSAYLPNSVKSTFSFNRAYGKKAILRDRSTAFHVITYCVVVLGLLKRLFQVQYAQILHLFWALQDYAALFYFSV
jgi:hypothetical protein